MSNPFDLAFEEYLPIFGVKDGACRVEEGPVPPPFDEPPTAPINTIRLDQDWAVQFKWETTGLLNYLMAGKWQLTVYLEEMGGGEFNLPGNTHELTFESKPHTYNYVFNFAAGSVPEGAYRIVTTIDMVGLSGYQGPISAVGEGPIIRFYEVGL
jgi:hypothetical protein